MTPSESEGDDAAPPPMSAEDWRAATTPWPEPTLRAHDQYPFPVTTEPHPPLGAPDTIVVTAAPEKPSPETRPLVRKSGEPSSVGGPSTSSVVVACAVVPPTCVCCAVMPMARPLGRAIVQAHEVVESCGIEHPGWPPGSRGSTFTPAPASFVPVMPTVFVGEKPGAWIVKVGLDPAAPGVGEGLGTADAPVTTSAMPANARTPASVRNRSTPPAPRSRNAARKTFVGEGCIVLPFRSAFAAL